MTCTWQLIVLSIKTQPTVTLDTTITNVHLTDVAIPSSHRLQSAIMEKLQKYRDLKDEFVRIWQLNCIAPLALSTMGIIPNKLHDSLELLNFRPDQYILIEVTVILSIGGKFLRGITNNKFLGSDQHSFRTS
jgi:hypothetical protein